jgi:lipoprotein signal peptidase
MTARSRRALTALIAVALGAADLIQKATAGPSLQHERSAASLVVMAAVVGGLVFVVPLVPWTPVAIGAGIAAGGAIGNLVSLLVWSGGVPDPLVLRGAAGGIAFNLADVFVFCGDLLLLSSAAVFAMRHRGRLRLPV